MSRKQSVRKVVDRERFTFITACIEFLMPFPADREKIAKAMYEEYISDVVDCFNQGALEKRPDTWEELGEERSEWLDVAKVGIAVFAKQLSLYIDKEQKKCYKPSSRKKA